MRYISLINQLIMNSSRCNDPAIGKMMKRASEGLRELQEELPKWIPASEQVPKPYQGVIVARKSGKDGPLVVDIGMQKPDGMWKVYGVNTKKVIYWMPLPGAPDYKKEEP